MSSSELPPTNRDDSSSSSRRLWFWILIALAIPIIPFVVIGELPGEKWLSGTDENAWLFFLTGAGLLAADTLLPVPSSILATALGARLGWFAGGLAAFCGLFLGSMIGYGVGRTLSRHKPLTLPERPGLGLVIVSRPVPVLSEAIAVTAGVAKLSLWKFVMASALSNAVVALVYAGAGARFLPSGWAGPGLIIPLGVPVLAWLIMMLVKKRREAPAQR